MRGGGVISLEAWMPTSKIYPCGYYSNRGTFAGAATRLRKQTCVLGVRKGNLFRFRTPKKAEQIAKIARKHKQIERHYRIP